jgi:hypothetical protein
MITIIAGSRNLELTSEKFNEIIKEFKIVKLLNGKCPTGIDAIAYKWAETNKIPIEEYPADWSKGLSAGPVRNRLMASKAECLIAIYRKNNLTPGTENMIHEAKKRKLKIFIKIIE